MIFLLFFLLLIPLYLIYPDIAFSAPNAISQQFVIPGAVSSGDDSLCILQEIFGQNVVSNAWTPQGSCLGYGSVNYAAQLSNAMTSSMAIYTSACFSLVGLIVTYWWVVAAMTGASTGQPMHTLINPIWAPIRVAFSSAMLASTQGYALIQFVILYLVGSGVGLADNVWVNAVQSFMSSNGAANAAATVKNTNWMQMQDTVNNMFNMELCKIFVNTEGTLSEQTVNGQQIPQYVAQVSGPPSTMQGPGYSYWINVYDQNSNASSEQQNGACGVLEFGSLPPATSSALSNLYSNASTVAQSNEQNAIQQLEQTIDSVINNTQMVNVVINPQQINAPAQTTTPNLNQYAQQVGQQNQYYQQNIGALSNAITQYADAMAMSASQAQLSGSITNGWFWAGDYYQNLEKSVGFIVNLASSVPAFPSAYAPLSGPIATEGFSVPSQWQTDMQELEKEAQYYEQNYGYQSTNQPNGTGGIGQGTQSCSGNLMPGIPTSYVSSLANGVGTQIAAIILQSAEDSNGCVGDLLLAEAQMGRTLSDLGMSLMAGGAIGTVLSGFVGNAAKFIPGVGSLAGGVSKFTGSLTKGMTYMGIMAFFSGVWLQFVLPELPALYWLAFCIGWLIMVIELVLAGPVWAVAHAIPEGPGFAGSMARRGYMTLLGVMAYPTLGIFALLASLAMLNVGGSIVLKYYFNASENLASLNSVTESIIGSIAYAFLYIGVLTAISGTILNMISSVPKAILSFIGAETRHISDANIPGAANTAQGALSSLGKSATSAAGGIMDTAEAVGGMAGQSVGMQFSKAPSSAAKSENEIPGGGNGGGVPGNSQPNFNNPMLPGGGGGNGGAANQLEGGGSTSSGRIPGGNGPKELGSSGPTTIIDI